MAEVQRKRKFSRVNLPRKAFTVFQQEAKKNEKKTQSEISDMWKTIEDKSNYEEISKQEFEQFPELLRKAGYEEDIIDTWVSSHSNKPKRQKKKEKVETQLKRPMNSVFQFVNDNIADVRKVGGITEEEKEIIFESRWKLFVKKTLSADTDFYATNEKKNEFLTENRESFVEPISHAEARVVLHHRWAQLPEDDEVKQKYINDAEAKRAEWIALKEQNK